MYKSKLQELCQKKSWVFPDYTTIKQGPSHSPCFKTTVTVNGVSFDTPDSSCKHLKESQSEAAKLAYLHFTTDNNPISSSGAISGVSLLHNMPLNGEVVLPNLQEKSHTPQNDQNSSAAIDTTIIDVHHVYKNQLQTYAQKRNLGLPEYACKREGPPHASRFSCKVTVAEEMYESPGFFSTLKEAEHAAAKVALMSLFPPGVSEDTCLVYKNLLQELVQKEGLCLPTYSTNSCGLPHMPTFVSTVEIKGEIFQGEVAKTKKQAEMNAAKVAYIVIKERGMCRSYEFIPAICQLQEATSSSLKSTFTVDLQENVRLESPPAQNINVLPQEANKLERAGDQKASKQMSLSTLQAQIPCINPGSEITRKRGASDIPYACLQNPSPSVPSTSDGELSSCSVPIESISDSASDLKLEQPMGTNTLPCKKVCVLPRKLNMKLPDGVTVFSDEKWIAIETGGPEETTN